MSNSRDIAAWLHALAECNLNQNVEVFDWDTWNHGTVGDDVYDPIAEVKVVALDEATPQSFYVRTSDHRTFTVIVMAEDK